ncbi:hypothetical protein [Roseburia sp. 499]|uniref:hypothetical protein n=1 Tax=Roseburia sp. 499 TaxID=1261634 RepID=UPI000950D442|nr:hypothetical protein [Roseburia sp. 499]WVK70092.1 hypothetical protein BIV20_00760 [Roseburia sp. 499]
MKKKSLVYSLFTGTLLSLCLLTSCNNATNNTSSVKNTTLQEETDKSKTADLQSPTDETMTETIPITIQVVNMCGVEIGTFSVIDPATGEQINMESIADQEMLSIDTNWPVDTETFQWALYNKNGELCLEGNSNIVGVTSRATLVLTGSGNVENIEVTVE